jgi:hypothetical protein
MAVASGAKGAEAVVLLGDDRPAEDDLAALRDFAGDGVPVHHGNPSGQLAGTVTS